MERDDVPRRVTARGAPRVHGVEEALGAGATLILLDNFDLETLSAAVGQNAKRAELEASGGITLATLREVALTGVDRISIGALTKDVKALDLSMRLG